MDLDRLKDALTERCRRAGYPEFVWWIPLAMDGFALMAGAVAAAQRADSGNLLPAAGLVALALAPWGSVILGRRLPWWAFGATTILATSVLMVSFPVDYDFAALVLVMLVGHLGSVEPLVRSLVATVVTGAVLFVLGAADLIEGSSFWLAGLVVGWDIGFIMQYQQRRLEEEQRLHAEHEARAVLDERQRIAREVHDVIAHSLSVTMLHLTAARRSLEEDRAEGVDEAVDALRDAERQGRQAMSDIRQTVGLLGQDAGRPAPSPDLRDLPALVEGFRAAGLAVDLDVRGDTRVVPPNTCLSLYRIVQESLANVAKHEPQAAVSVALHCGEDGQRLSVTNGLRSGGRQQPGGSGLKGMRERAELLGGSFDAGVVDGRWVVDVSIPSPREVRDSSCVLGFSRAQVDPA